MRRITLLLVIALVCTAGSAFAAGTLNLTAKQAVALTLQNNPQLQQVLAGRNAALAQVGMAESYNWPTVTLSDSFTPAGYQSVNYNNFQTYPIGSISSDGGTGLTNGLQVAVQYPVFTGGQITYSIAKAKTALTIIDQKIEQVKQQLQYNASAGYFMASYYKDTVKVAQTTLDAANEHLRVVKAQYSAGVVAKSDVLRTQADVASAQKNLISAQNQYELSLLSLKTLMNISLDTVIVLSEDLSYAQQSLNTNDLLDFAFKNRPDYQMTLLTITQDEYAKKVSEAGYYPTVALAASYSNQLGYQIPLSTSKISDTVNQVANAASISAQLQYNVFDGFLTRNQVKAATAQVDADKQASALSKLQVINEVNQSVDNVMTDLKLIAANKAYLNFAEENYKINLVQYAAGVTTNLNVMDAINQLTTAQTAYYQALFYYNKDMANLALVTGRPVK